MVISQTYSIHFNEITRFSERYGLTYLLPLLSHFSKLLVCSYGYSSLNSLFHIFQSDPEWWTLDNEEGTNETSHYCDTFWMVVWKGSSETRPTTNIPPHDISITEAPLWYCVYVQMWHSFIYNSNPNYVCHFQLQNLINVFGLVIMWQYYPITKIYWEESVSMS